MTEQMQTLSAQWTSLKAQAQSGELKMDPEICAALRGHVDKLILKLDTLRNLTGQMAHLTGFGTLPTAVAMQHKFEGKATAGDASAAERLKQSIEVLTLMSDTYEKATGAIQDTDQSNSQKFANVDMGDQ